MPLQCATFAYLPGRTTAVPAGLLTIYEDGSPVQASQFGYGSRYLERVDAIAVDPVSLPLEEARPGSVRLYEPVNGLPLFGAVRDAIPDQWGRRLIENLLRVPANSLSESDYLMRAGEQRFGALDFRDTADAQARATPMPPVTELAYLLEAADRVQRNERIPQALAPLFNAGTSLGGARPKAVIERAGRLFIAKFPAAKDPFNVPLIECATLELARECGLRVPELDLIDLPDGRQVMLIERFDREPAKSGEQLRHHAVSALTILGRHEQASSQASYSEIARAISTYGATQIAEDLQELFARMVFNILVSNDDDHLRNHAFVFDAKVSGWKLSPLFDVLPRPQVAQERFLGLGVGANGRLATIANARSHAGQFGLLAVDADAIIDHLVRCVRSWRVSFERLGVSKTECDSVAAAFRHPKEIGA